MRDALTVRIQAHGIGDRVRLTGWLDDGQLVLDGADVFLPTTHDTCGLALAHALASGLPSVVADTPVVREVWSPAVTNVPVEPNAIATYKTGRRHHSDAGRAHVQTLAARWERDLNRQLARL